MRDSEGRQLYEARTLTELWKEAGPCLLGDTLPEGGIKPTWKDWVLELSDRRFATRCKPGVSLAVWLKVKT